MAKAVGGKKAGSAKAARAPRKAAPIARGTAKRDPPRKQRAVAAAASVRGARPAPRASGAAVATAPAPAPVRAMGTFEDLIAKVPPTVQAVARCLRQIVRGVLPGAREIVYLGSWRLALYKDVRKVCGIQPAPDRCQVYIMNAAEIPDPERLMEGSGKKIRHVTVRSIDLLPVGALQQLIRASQQVARGGT